MNKRASIGISMFVILGIVGLLAVGGVAYLFSSSNLSLEKSAQTQKQVVPLQIEPLQDYIDDCIQTLGVQGLKNAAKHGGYILDSNIKALKFNRHDITRHSESIYFDTQSTETKIPYWYYIDCGNDDPSVGASCEFKSFAPKIEDVKKNMGTYIDNNLDACLGTFGDYSLIYDITKESNKPTTTIDFSDDDMIISTKYNIKLNSLSSGESFTLTHFSLKIPTKFKQIYEIANQLSAEESNKRIVEKAMTNWIDAYSGLDNTRFLPPKYKFDLYGSPVIWTVETAKEYYSNILNFYMTQRFQVMGSTNYDNYNDGLLDTSQNNDGAIATYKKMIFTNASANILNFEVNFMRNPQWPLLFKINGQTNGIIRPESSGMIPNAGFIPFPEIHEYKNYYSIETPIIVSIVDNDPDELFGDSYSFKMAWDPKIANNFPVESINTFDGTSNQNFETQYCDPLTWNNNAYVKFIDSKTKEPIANITAKTYGGIDCYLTKDSDKNGLIQGLPNGINNQLKIVYDDKYVLYDDQSYSINPDMRTTLIVKLMKVVKPKHIDMKKQLIFKDTFNYCYQNNLCKQMCNTNNNYDSTCFKDCQEEYKSYSVIKQDLVKNPITKTYSCAYNITYKKCDKTTNTCVDKNEVISATPNSVVFFNITKPLDFPTNKKIESLAGTLDKKLNGSEISEGLQAISFTLDNNSRNELISSGFVKGRYQFAFSYSEDSSYDSIYNDIDNINTEEDLKNRVSDYDITDLGKVSVYTYDKIIDNTLYNNMENLNMSITVPILDFSTLSESDFSNYDLFNYTFLESLNHQPILDTIPDIGIFPNKPKPHLYLDVIRFK